MSDSAGFSYGRLSSIVMRSTLGRNEKLVLMAILVSVDWETWSGKFYSSTIIERSGLKRDAYQKPLAVIGEMGLVSVHRVIGEVPMWTVDPQRVASLDILSIAGSTVSGKNPSAGKTRQREKPAHDEPEKPADRGRIKSVDREPEKPAASSVPLRSRSFEDPNHLRSDPLEDPPTPQGVLFDENEKSNIPSSPDSKKPSRTKQKKTAPKEGLPLIEQRFKDSSYSVVLSKLWYGTECHLKDGPRADIFAIIADLLVAFGKANQAPVVADRTVYNLARSTVMAWLDAGQSKDVLMAIAIGPEDPWQVKNGGYTFLRTFKDVDAVQRALARLKQQPRNRGTDPAYYNLPRPGKDNTYGGAQQNINWKSELPAMKG